MMEKIRLTSESMKEITKSDQIFKSMKELVLYIQDDPSAKGELRKFLYKNNFKQEFNNFSERLKCFEENFFIEGDDGIDIENSNDKEENDIPKPDSDDFVKIIEKFEADGYRQVTAAEDEILSSQTITLTESSVIEKGELKISWYGDEEIDTSRVIIAEKAGNKVLALGTLLLTPDNKHKYWAIFDNRDWIRHSEIAGNNQVRIVIFTKGNRSYSQIVDLEYHEMQEEVEKPLCIDFGTSNTTVGTYGIKSKETGDLDDDIVKFVDVTVEPHRTDALMMPTVVYVEDCSDVNNIKYLFGYEALKQIEQVEHYQIEASVFFEIKRWMLVPSLKEDIRDKDNNHAEVERQQIIKAYIDYVIDLSEQYYGRRFKKIHFSAPVKLKSLFISTFRDLYAGVKEVLSEDESIDEAFAIVYNHIMNLIDRDKRSMKNQKVFIMDCGGGTTDLANCTFSYERRDGYTDRLTYTTSFKNGNSNFGGNNLTYRIMQLLKIKISEKYVNDDSICGDAKVLINKSEDEIFDSIEKNKALKLKTYDSDKAENEVYKDFSQMYEKCESIIPTCFADEKDQADKKKKKRNFYYMWRLGERIKIEFFSTDQVRIEFGNTDVPVPLRVDTSNDYFWIDSDGRLVKQFDPLKGIVITNKDVERVICGDIYGLLFGLIGDGNLDDETNVANFNHYKLSGQSCKISMFKELLKEYIPGKQLRAKKGNSNNSEKLKLECLKGCIQYIRDKKGHELTIESTFTMPQMIYDIYIKNQHTADELIFDSKNKDDENIRFKVFSTGSSEMFFEIKNSAGLVEKKVEMSLVGKSNEMEYYGSDKLVEELVDKAGIKNERAGSIVNNMIERIGDTVDADGVKVLFAIPSADNYGVVFILIQAAKEENLMRYKLINRKHCSFENPDKTFFDGRR